jgi:hypothetical protein
MYYGCDLPETDQAVESKSKASLTPDAFKERLKPGNRTSGISKKVKMNQSKVEGKESKRTPVSALSALLRKLKRVGYCYEFEG